MNFEGKKKVNICSSRFGSLISYDCVFVDKTSFIKRILDENLPQPVFLFTRPRRFGKTLTLDMVKTFFNAENAETNRAFFQGLQIEQAGEKYMAEQGQYPVISISFADTKPMDEKEFEPNIAAYLREVCNNFYYLSESDVLTPGDKSLLRKWCEIDTPLSSYKRMLGVLSQWLQKVHPQHHPVILLIDEYDTPLQVAYENGYYKTAANFFRDFLCNGLKTNQYLKFAMLTGILRVAKESIFSGLNNFRPYTIFDKRYSDVFGFTQEEIDQLLTYYECPDKRNEIKEWYDGYNFGGRQMYNPWSVLNYLQEECAPANYWINTSGTNFITKICAKLNDEKDRIDLEKLLLGETLLGESISSVVTYDDNLEERSVALGYLLMAGYLKAQPTANRPERYNIDVPNYEVRDAFQREIVQRLKRIYHLHSKISDALQDAVIAGDKDKFQALLQEYIIKVCSYHDDTASAKPEEHRPESFYHGLLVGLSALMGECYNAKSNLESGLGRSDLLLIPRTDTWQPKNLPLIVMEFKKAATGDDLYTAAQKALEQIHQRQYDKGVDMKCQHLLYGLAFRSKEVAIVADEVPKP